MRREFHSSAPWLSSSMCLAVLFISSSFVCAEDDTRQEVVPQAQQEGRKEPAGLEAKLGKALSLPGWGQLVVVRESSQLWLPKHVKNIEWAADGALKGRLEVFTLKFSGRAEEVFFFLAASPENSYVSVAIGESRFVPFSVVTQNPKDGPSFYHVSDDLRRGIAGGKSMYILESQFPLSFLFDLPTGLASRKRQLHLRLAVGEHTYNITVND